MHHNTSAASDYLLSKQRPENSSGKQSNSYGFGRPPRHYDSDRSQDFGNRFGTGHGKAKTPRFVNKRALATAVFRQKFDIITGASNSEIKRLANAGAF